jgi:hypothetical protein
MDRILLVAAIAFLYSSPSLAADKGQASVEFQYSLVTYQEIGLDEAKPTAWVGQNGQLANEKATIEERSLHDSLNSRKSVPEAGIGFGVGPLFGTYGVYRTGSNQEGSTYHALGFTLDDFAMDEAVTSDSNIDSGLSYGIGINKRLYNIEYMVSVDEGGYKISAIGVSFISEF